MTAGRGGRERVCVCVRGGGKEGGLRASRLTMGRRARFVMGVILEAAGTQTESGGGGRVQ